MPSEFLARRSTTAGLPRFTALAWTMRLRSINGASHPLIITLGGNGGDQYNEGAVGREYLEGMGVPESAIIAETESRNTEESARRIAVIARANGLQRLVIVSDGTHLFRIHEICAAEGLDVLTSPRPRVPVERWNAAKPSASPTRF